jgi:hypothetical protein
MTYDAGGHYLEYPRRVQGKCIDRGFRRFPGNEKNAKMAARAHRERRLRTGLHRQAEGPRVGSVESRQSRVAQCGLSAVAALREGLIENCREWLPCAGGHADFRRADRSTRVAC